MRGMTDRSTVKNKLITLKVNEHELAHIRRCAAKYANGNVSDWLRWAAINFIPEVPHGSEEKVEEDPCDL